MLKIAVLVSGNGSNLQAIINSINSGTIQCSIEKVISDRPKVYALERAEKEGISTIVLDRKQSSEEELSEEILAAVEGRVDYIILAGFLSILKGDILQRFKNRIINIHPSLLPSFCGNGMYGLKVHEKAIEYGVKVSGCTVHFVEAGTDTGPIILQKTVPVYGRDTAKTLQQRILLEEHSALISVVKFLCEGKIKVEGRNVQVEDSE